LWFSAKKSGKIRRFFDCLFSLNYKIPGASMKLRIPLAIALGLCCAQVHAADQTKSAAAQPATTAVTVQTTTQPATATQPETTTVTVAKPTAPAAAAMPAIPGFATDKEKISYAIGIDLGANFKAQGIDVDPATLQRGIQDILAGGKLAMTKEQVAAIFIAFRKNMEAKQKAAFEVASAQNLQEGTAFLAANKTKPGVTTTASGLQYKVITPGKGASPVDKDIVTVDYTGTFINGKVFDSSYQHGKPVSFPVTDVIAGWTEALKLMHPGETVEIYVPAKLAYGERGMPGAIGPNQTLVFKIHLISVKKAG
jgi:FKBP-type peptidyl-prolyl cis-trans isomerase FklB